MIFNIQVLEKDERCPHGISLKVVREEIKSIERTEDMDGMTVHEVVEAHMDLKEGQTLKYVEVEPEHVKDLIVYIEGDIANLEHDIAELEEEMERKREELNMRKALVEQRKVVMDAEGL